MLIVSIIMEKASCPSCNGPIGPLVSSYVTCAYCGTEFYLPPMPGFRIPAPRVYPQLPGLAVVQVAGAEYRVHGRLAQGRHCDVFLARRERAFTEMVVLKIARDGGEAGLRREWDVLQLVREAHPFLAYLTCAPVARGIARLGGHPERDAAVYRWRSGFVFTFLEAHAEYPLGVDPRAAVWMWNRILDQLACLQDAGLGHNALSPVHLLIHPRDHGVALCGWSEAAKGPSNDLAASAHCIAGLLGDTAPSRLLDLTQRAGDFPSAVAVKEELKRISEAAFGPPRFHQFKIQGGRHGIR